MKDNINEHDKTKQMMDIIRNGFKSKLITEAEEEQAIQPQPEQPQPTAMQPGDDLPEPEIPQDESADVITPVKGDSVYNEEQKNLASLDPRINLRTFKIYPEAQDVMIQGDVSVGGSLIKFTMKYQEGKLITNFADVETNDETLGMLQKLNGYSANFINQWADKLRDDYPPKNNQ